MYREHEYELDGNIYITFPIMNNDKDIFYEELEQLIEEIEKETNSNG